MDGYTPEVERVMTRLFDSLGRETGTQLDFHWAAKQGRS
jgi:hypothetical protein